MNIGVEADIRKSIERACAVYEDRPAFLQAARDHLTMVGEIRRQRVLGNEIIVGSNKVELSPGSYELTKRMARDLGQFVPRDKLIGGKLGPETENALRMAVGRLRHETAGVLEISSSYGKGYRLTVVNQG